MSESDSFIREVTEEVRQDRMFALWKKWGPYVIALVVLAVGGAALWSWMEARERTRAEQVGGILLGAEPGSVLEQQTAVAVLDPPARIVAEFGEAAALAENGEHDKAAALYRELATRGDLARHSRDLALLQALRIEAVDGDPAALLSELQPLTEDGAPYALLARELAAVLHLKAGDEAAARTELQAILSSPQVTQGLGLRTQELLTVLGAPEDDGTG